MADNYEKDAQNWSFVIEAIGPTHNNIGQVGDANLLALEFVRACEAAGHRILQIRFSGSGGEENWRVDTTRDMHEQLYASCHEATSPHEELVAQGVKADASGKQVTKPLGTGKQKPEDKGGLSSKGLHIGDTKGSDKVTAGAEEAGKQ